MFWCIALPPLLSILPILNNNQPEWLGLLNYFRPTAHVVGLTTVARGPCANAANGVKQLATALKSTAPAGEMNNTVWLTLVSSLEWPAIPTNHHRSRTSPPQRTRRWTAPVHLGGVNCFSCQQGQVRLTCCTVISI